MLLHDACHSIDSFDIGPILEIVKFPNSSRAENRHDRPLNLLPDRSAGTARPTAEALLPAAVAAAPQVLAAKKFNLRKLLLTGAAIAALAGAAWYGWDYWTVGQYLVSTDDAYVKADSTTIAPEGHRLPASGAGRRTMSASRPARCWRGSTTATSRSRSTRPRRMSRRREATIASKQAQLDVQQAVINSRQGHARRRSGRGDLRRAGEQALHRSRRDRLRQRAERAAGAGADCRRAGHAGARQRQSRVRAQAGRSAQGRDRAGQRGARACRGGAAPGRTQSRLHHDHRSDRRRRRQPHAARRPVSCRPARS